MTGINSRYNLLEKAGVLLFLKNCSQYLGETKVTLSPTVDCWSGNIDHTSFLSPICLLDLIVHHKVLIYAGN